MIIFLHGHGERITNPNNEGQVRQIEQVNYSLPPREIARGHDMCFTMNGVSDCFAVFSPAMEESEGHNWMNSRNNVRPFVTYVLDTYPGLDPDRVYLTGFSMGASGTYSAALAESGDSSLYTAIAPVALSNNFTENDGCQLMTQAEVPV